MGILETEVKKQIRISKVKKAILQTVAAAGLISVAVLAPNALQILKPFIKNKRAETKTKYYINYSRSKLIEQGLIKKSSTGFYELTKEGLLVLKQCESRNYKISAPRKWDGKWRMLIFDIKENRRGTRDKVRNTLNSIGFVMLQKSVWVYPYDCEDLINLLKIDFMIGKDMLYVIADKIENDIALKDSFRI